MEHGRFSSDNGGGHGMRFGKSLDAMDAREGYPSDVVSSRFYAALDKSALSSAAKTVARENTETIAKQMVAARVAEEQAALQREARKQALMEEFKKRLPIIVAVGAVAVIALLSFRKG